MSIVSNLYADKAFSEHPSALWSLDDSADYVSLMSNSDRDVYNWTKTSCSAVQILNVKNEPFINSSVTRINVDVIESLPDGNESTCSLESNEILNFEDLQTSLGTFAISTYVYAGSPYVTGYEIGYEYYNNATGSWHEVTKIFNIAITQRWLFLSETFKIPDESGSMRLIFKIRFLGGYSALENFVLVNGFSCGQWSEEFSSTSLGVQPIQLPSGIFDETVYGYPARSYGLEDRDGYYLINKNSLCSKNSGAPMVYGTQNCTVIYPNEEKPSLVLPSLGFLNNVGKYKTYTVEMWLRVNCNTTTPKKIFGNIEDDNGLYVDGPFIVLKIGNKSASHYVGEWVRPMLLHILYLEDSFKLYINGEEVISVYQKTSDISFNSSKEWLGFWAYDDVTPIELDCVGIYPYKVSNIVAKRRFVYGQGVESPDNINTAYSGKSLLIDYSVADYSNNYSYPNIGKWGQGTVDNLSINKNILSTPDYTLPTIEPVLSTNTNSWITANSSIQTEDDLFFRIKPNSINSSKLYFENLNFLNQQIKSVYGVFKIVTDLTDPMTLFHIVDPNNNTFSVCLYKNLSTNTVKIQYIIKLKNKEEEILDWESVDIIKGEKFYAGFNINNAVNYFGGGVATILGNISQCKLFIGSTDASGLERPFLGNIYKVGLCNERNNSLIASAFGADGLPAEYLTLPDYIEALKIDAGLYNRILWDALADGGTASNILGVENIDGATSVLFDIVNENIATYTLVASKYLDEYSLDIDVSGYWEDYQPLTYYAQYVKDLNGDQYYDLDFLQFNIDYPSPSKFYEIESTGEEWSYAQLYNLYNYPRKRTYDSLDNFLFTSYRDYEDLQFNKKRTYKYDTTDSLVRSYITFQYIKSGANQVPGFFTKVEAPAKEGTVEPGTDWIYTKYETVDNMVVYIPKNVDFNDLAIVTHLEFKTKNIIRNKIKLRSLEYCSQAFNQANNPIGTIPYEKMYPYRKSGIYYSYKGKNPYTIYKRSSPYLYMTRNSGVQIRGKFDPLVNRGLLIPINKDGLSNFDKIMAMQVAIRFDEDYFPYAPTQIFEVEAKNAYIRFYMVATDQTGQRARIYGINANTGRVEDGIAFYLNGNIVKDPVITIKQWSFLGISFSNLLDISSTYGSIKLNGPLLFNNISYYQSTNLQEVQKVSTRPWLQVKRSGPLPLDWEYWLSKSFLWNGVLVASSISYYGVSPDDIYKSYVGTNKFSVSTDKVFSIGDCEYNVYQNILWQQTTSSAV